MTQIKQGTVTVTNGSATVTGSGTSWLGDVSAGDYFIVREASGIDGRSEVYVVGGVSTDTSLTLTAPWGGATASDVPYAIHIDFLPSGLPKILPGDLESSAIFNQAMQKISNGTLGLDNASVSTGTGDQTLVAALDQRTIPVNTVADLKALPGAKPGLRVSTKEYHSGTGAGGNNYVIEALDGSADDGGSVIHLNDGVHQAQGLFPGGVFVEQFGAKGGDPNFDDSSSFDAAINYGGVARSKRKGISYRFESTVTQGDHSIEIDGNGCTIMQAHNGAHFSLFSGVLYTTNVMLISGATISVDTASPILTEIESRLSSYSEVLLKLVSDDALAGQPNPSKRQGEFVFVDSVDSTSGQITLKTEPVDTYTTSPRIGIWKTENKLVIKNIVFDTENIGFLGSNIFCSGWHKPFFDNISVLRNGTTSIVIRGCYGHIFRNPNIRNLTNDLGDGRPGYGIDDSMSENGVIYAGEFFNTRHGYTTNTGAVSAGSSLINYGRTRNTKVVACHAVESTAAALDAHTEATGIEFHGCTTEKTKASPGYQLRGDGQKMFNCVSRLDSRGVDSKNGRHEMHGCVIDRALTRVFIIENDSELVVFGGDFESTESNIAIDIRDGSKLTASGSTFKYSASGNDRILGTFTDTSSCEMSGCTLDISGMSGDDSLIWRINSGATIDATFINTRLIFGGQAENTGTSFLRNNSANNNLLIVDNALLHETLAGSFLKFGDGFGTYSAGSGYSYKTKQSRTEVSAIL